MGSHKHASRPRRLHPAAPEAQWARWRSPWKRWLVGVLLVVADLLGTTLLIQAGCVVAAMLWAVLCALPLGLLAMLAAGSDAVVGCIALCVACVVVIGGAGVGQGEVRLFGRTAHDVVAADANDGMAASFLHFRNARVLAGQTGAEDVYGSNGAGKLVSYHLYTLRVAPVVDAGWSLDQPVTILAVLGSPQFGHHAAEWAKPWNGAIRWSGFERQARDAAVQDLVRRGLHVAPDPLFVRWSPDPEGEAAATRTRLLLTLMVEIVAWSLLWALLQGLAAFRRRGGATTRAKQ